MSRNESSPQDRSGQNAAADPILNDSINSLRNIASAMRRKRKLAFSIFFAVLIIAVGYLIVVPPKYKATAVILVDPRQQRVVQSEEVLAGIGSDSAAVESQVELLKSAAVAPEMLTSFSIFEDPEFNRTPILKTVSAALGLDVHASVPVTVLDQTLERNKAIAAFEKKLSVYRRGLTYVLEVGFTSVDPRKAAAVANAVAEAYLDDLSARKQEAAEQASAWLIDRLANLREQVWKSEQAVAEFKAKYDIVDLGASNSGETLRKLQIDKLNEQLSAARTETALQKARYEQALKASEDFSATAQIPDVLDSQVIGNLRIIHSDLKREEVRNSDIYGSKHPSLKNIRTEIETIRQLTDAEIKRILASIEKRYEVAQQTQEALEAELRVQMEQSAEINQLTVILRELERNAAADRNVLEQFLNRLKETTEQVSLKKPDARIVSPARIPTKPSSTGGLVIMAGATFLGMLLAAGGALVVDQAERGSAQRRRREDV
ncbi:GumC family protein [Hoeflea poritis]|uniref:GumC family protein n=1 Tax=Hoeflea poritis TaxID=2993659 RepID=A0ABT4VUF4_9HYPH|nr:GumC family protein [Hoeflea poritis]MDA4848343.1 GumC family protein [Hoeflea poritis]